MIKITNEFNKIMQIREVLLTRKNINKVAYDYDATVIRRGDWGATLKDSKGRLIWVEMFYQKYDKEL